MLILHDLLREEYGTAGGILRAWSTIVIVIQELKGASLGRDSNTRLGIACAITQPLIRAPSLETILTALGGSQPFLPWKDYGMYAWQSAIPTWTETNRGVAFMHVWIYSQAWHVHGRSTTKVDTSQGLPRERLRTVVHERLRHSLTCSRMAKADQMESEHDLSYTGSTPCSMSLNHHTSLVRVQTGSSLSACVVLYVKTSIDCYIPPLKFPDEPERGYNIGGFNHEPQNTCMKIALPMPSCLLISWTTRTSLWWLIVISPRGDNLDDARGDHIPSYLGNTMGCMHGGQPSQHGPRRIAWPIHGKSATKVDTRLAFDCFMNKGVRDDDTPCKVFLKFVLQYLPVYPSRSTPREAKDCNAWAFTTLLNLLKNGKGRSNGKRTRPKLYRCMSWEQPPGPHLLDISAIYNSAFLIRITKFTFNACIGLLHMKLNKHRTRSTHDKGYNIGGFDHEPQNTCMKIALAMPSSLLISWTTRTIL
ncbi:hypothetical protein VNO77_03581 [Canavalia gladiata]|uniref:Uncharacterized protein n=1 Tax=Canavalia gladiata TaxID=3824 RepID=A0AAN9N007_CANGL